MGVIAGTIGRIYYWFKEGRKENFWKRVFWETDYTQEELNREHYKGLEIIYVVGGIIGIIIVLYTAINEWFFKK